MEGAEIVSDGEVARLVLQKPSHELSKGKFDCELSAALHYSTVTHPGIPVVWTHNGVLCRTDQLGIGDAWARFTEMNTGIAN